MMSLETICELANDSGKLAESLGLEPFFIEHQEQIDSMPPFPDLGNYEPSGWLRVNTLFCDSSGFGSSGEPALTPEQIRAELKIGRGYAIVETGQFQLYLGEFKRTRNPDGSALSGD